MWKSLPSLLKKDCQMMVSGKFFLVAFGSFLLYSLFINFGYLNFLGAEAATLYHVYLYDPAGAQMEASPLVHPVASPDELGAALASDANGVGVAVGSESPSVILYAATEEAGHHKADYALALLHPGENSSAETIGKSTLELRQRREITCELLFIEIVALGFLGIASVLFKEKQMGVIRVHAILPLEKNLFIFSKVVLFLLTDLVFAVLMAVCNIGPREAGAILPAVLVQTTILSLIMALVGFGCTLLLKDFKQFSLAYLVIALFAATPVFMAANTSARMSWISYHPFYHVYLGLKNAFFDVPVISPVYYAVAAGFVVLLFYLVGIAFRYEMGREG